MFHKIMAMIRNACFQYAEKWYDDVICRYHSLWQIHGRLQSRIIKHWIVNYNIIVITYIPIVSSVTQLTCHLAQTVLMLLHATCFQQNEHRIQEVFGSSLNLDVNTQTEGWTFCSAPADLFCIETRGIVINLDTSRLLQQTPKQTKCPQCHELHLQKQM